VFSSIIKFAGALAMAAALFAAPRIGCVPVRAAQVIRPAQDMVIEVNQGRLVRIDRAASIIFVANSAIAEVAVNSPRVIFVFAKKPGVTTLYAVDHNENVVANIQIVVTHELAELQQALKFVIPPAGVREPSRATPSSEN
jgi:pilus assembly protein CpaC